ncbi:uncharacterized protein LOC114259266 isoform X2 [Camellia sinensis]|uniref:uncharacterized protein LOC114259266 isoform X2 n=1 Tax=Camellia sinensis TaxID=4442 RepID=UPI001036574F|nr:uncharacterized protein LOC114259266 isoform X2 [Camellia sinensis]
MAAIASFKLSSIPSCILQSPPSSSSSSSLSFSWKPSVLPMRVFPGTQRRPTFPKIFAFSSNDIKVGSNIEVDGSPWKVIEFLHVKPGKGAAYVRTTLRNYVTGNSVEKTFRAGSKNTYEEYRLNESFVGDKTKWLKEGMDCNLLFWNGKVIDFELPITVKLTVVEVDPGLKGDTAQGGSKPATLETGAVVSVPLFVDRGQAIMVDTRTGQYMSRA